MKPITAFDFNSIIVTAIEVAEKADDYQYGAVAAPSWALPLGAVLVIATAAIPVLLKPGEEVFYDKSRLNYVSNWAALLSDICQQILSQAIAEQRKNEEIMGSNFNKRKDKDLR